jgi:hypothetical protein
MGFDTQNNHKLNTKKYIFLMHAGHNGKHSTQISGLSLQILASSDIQFVESFDFLHGRRHFTTGFSEFSRLIVLVLRQLSFS